MGLNYGFARVCFRAGLGLFVRVSPEFVLKMVLGSFRVGLGLM